MSKHKFKTSIESYGRYTKWQRGSKELPHILEFTRRIEAVKDNEFGMIVKFEHARNMQFEFCIKHPPFKDSNGKIAPNFTGPIHIPTNNYRFYLGDCIWLPAEDKTGIWETQILQEEKIIEQMQFEIFLP